MGFTSSDKPSTGEDKGRILMLQMKVRELEAECAYLRQDANLNDRMVREDTQSTASASLSASPEREDTRRWSAGATWQEKVNLRAELEQLQNDLSRANTIIQNQEKQLNRLRLEQSEPDNWRTSVASSSADDGQTPSRNLGSDGRWLTDSIVRQNGDHSDRLELEHARMQMDRYKTLYFKQQKQCGEREKVIVSQEAEMAESQRMAQEIGEQLSEVSRLLDLEQQKSSDLADEVSSLKTKIQTTPATDGSPLDFSWGVFNLHDYLGREWLETFGVSVPPVSEPGSSDALPESRPHDKDSLEAKIEEALAAVDRKQELLDAMDQQLRHWVKQHFTSVNECKVLKERVEQAEAALKIQTNYVDQLCVEIDDLKQSVGTNQRSPGIRPALPCRDPSKLSVRVFHQALTRENEDNQLADPLPEDAF